MIFISHSSKNEATAKKIRTQLEENHYKCFLSGDDLEADDDWQDEILSALYGCSVFLGLVSKDFINSLFCQQEIGAAIALGKPRMFIKYNDVSSLPGFVARYQACKHQKMIETLDTKPRYRSVRVSAWTRAVSVVGNYSQANEVQKRFENEWDEMDYGEKLTWLLAASSNSQVFGEGYHAGPFYKKAKKQLKSRLSDQWLYENDKHSDLHDRDENPLVIAELAKVKKKKKKKSTK